MATKKPVSGKGEKLTIEWDTVFAGLAIGFKFVLLLILGIVSVINRNMSYIKENPNRMLRDALITAAGMVIGIWFLDFSRTGRKLPTGGSLETIVMLGFFFFIYSILRELSGYYDYMKFDETHLSEAEKKHKKMVYGLSLALLIITVLTCLFFMWRVHRGLSLSGTHLFGFKNGGKGKNRSTSSTWFLFFLECIVFSVILAVPETVVDYFHLGDEHVKKSVASAKSFGMSLVLFIVCHMVFQFTGFYSVFYNPRSNHTMFAPETTVTMTAQT